MHFLTWLRYGSPVFDVARTAVPAARVARRERRTRRGNHADRVRQESREPWHAATAPSAFDCEAFRQRHDDCIYVPLSHDELYAGSPRLAGSAAFIRAGRFTAAATRTPPAGDPLASR